MMTSARPAAHKQKSCLKYLNMSAFRCRLNFMTIACFQYQFNVTKQRNQSFSIDTFSPSPGRARTNSARLYLYPEKGKHYSEV